MEICSNTQTEVQNISRKGYLSSNFCGGAGWAIGKEMLNWLLLFRFPTWGATNLICLVLVLPTVQRTQKARGLETMLRIFSRSEMFSPAVWPKLLEVEKTASKSIIHNVKPAEVLKQSLQPKPRKNRTVEQWLAKFCATTVTTIQWESQWATEALLWLSYRKPSKQGSWERNAEKNLHLPKYTRVKTIWISNACRTAVGLYLQTCAWKRNLSLKSYWDTSLRNLFHLTFNYDLV